MEVREAHDLGFVRQRAGIGVASFALREGSLRLLPLTFGVVLARLLDPEAFGLYAIAWFVVHLFSHFGDIGLGDALVRKPGDLTEQDCRTVLTLHVSLISILAVAVYLSAPLAIDLYRLDAERAWLVRAMIVPLFLALVRTMPAVRLERAFASPPSRPSTCWKVLCSRSSLQLSRYWASAFGASPWAQ